MAGLSLDSFNIPRFPGTGGDANNTGANTGTATDANGPHGPNSPYPNHPSNGLVNNLTSYYHRYMSFCNQLLIWFNQQSIIKKIMIIVLGILGIILVGLFMVFHVYIIKFMIYLSDKWGELKYGRLLLFTLVFFVGFPPLIGFSSLSVLCGMVYGIFSGWILLATASITGSFCSFLVFRYLLKSKADSLLKSNEKFRAFSEILKEDQSLLLLILIRLCPLPYSLSNGALASIPELSPMTYLSASILTAPKLFIHVFIGHQFKDIGDDHNSTLKRVIDGVSLVITTIASSVTTYIIYMKMQQRLAIYHNLLNNGGVYGDEGSGDYNDMIFGNFNDDDSGNNLELNSTDFDADNFIIENDDEAEAEAEADGSKVPDITKPLNLSNNESTGSISKPLYHDNDGNENHNDDDDDYDNYYHDVNDNGKDHITKAKAYRDY